MSLQNALLDKWLIEYCSHIMYRQFDDNKDTNNKLDDFVRGVLLMTKDVDNPSKDWLLTSSMYSLLNAKKSYVSLNGETALEEAVAALELWQEENHEISKELVNKIKEQAVLVCCERENFTVAADVHRRLWQKTIMNSDEYEERTRKRLMKMILGRNSTCVDDSFNELMVELKNWFKEIFEKRGMPHLLKLAEEYSSVPGFVMQCNFIHMDQVNNLNGSKNGMPSITPVNKNISIKTMETLLNRHNFSGQKPWYCSKERLFSCLQNKKNLLPGPSQNTPATSISRTGNLAPASCGMASRPRQLDQDLENFDARITNQMQGETSGLPPQMKQEYLVSSDSDDGPVLPRRKRSAASNGIIEDDRDSDRESYVTVGSIHKTDRIGGSLERSRRSHLPLADRISGRPNFRSPQPCFHHTDRNYIKPISRRPHSKWDEKEEETLYISVMKYGVGNWKDMVVDLPSRSNMDIKDKWRTLTRREDRYKALEKKFGPVCQVTLERSRSRSRIEESSSDD